MMLRDGTASSGRGLLTCVESFTSGVSGNTECWLLGSSLEDGCLLFTGFFSSPFPSFISSLFILRCVVNKIPEILQMSKKLAVIEIVLERQMAS